MAIDNEQKELVRTTVHEVLFQLGLSADDHEEVAELRKDFNWTRNARQTSEKVGMHGLLAVVTVAVGGALAAVWIGLQQQLGGGPHG